MLETSGGLTNLSFDGRFMSEIVLALSPFLIWLAMKKDNELPWAMRIFRWGVLAFCGAYGFLLIAEKWQEVFP